MSQPIGAGVKVKVGPSMPIGETLGVVALGASGVVAIVIDPNAIAGGIIVIGGAFMLMIKQYREGNKEPTLMALNEAKLEIGHLKTQLDDLAKKVAERDKQVADRDKMIDRRDAEIARLSERQERGAQRRIVEDPEIGLPRVDDMGEGPA